MTKLAIGAIRFYQVFLSSFLRQTLGVQSFCRFSPTCSEYAVMTIRQYGILYGSFKAVRRILSCQPFTKIT